eukprot:CAMPEP_0194275628 /NCGR_PEP_ID=MMETSP0169-20130528/8414_1 /TAXON_ID=218684 /ORGANISM="Corethron pennatum, Strain L29A3" /LENGTH=137 /DNA_ID=CAMNT_0039019131 /DNA_START=22 /DNA_END=432 /DNA_ORIENTATION=-
MSSDDLPDGTPSDGYDYVIVGTGLTQCVLCAALSAAGRRVLQVDASAQYGGADAGGFRGVDAAAEHLRELSARVTTDAVAVHSVSGGGDVPDRRDFCLDLSPRLVSAEHDGAEIRTLLRSGVHRYLEFRVTSRQHAV